MNKRVMGFDYTCSECGDKEFTIYSAGLHASKSDKDFLFICVGCGHPHRYYELEVSQ